MFNKTFKILLVILSLFILSFWAINYKSKSEQIIKNGYELFSNLKEIETSSNKLDEHILKAALYRIYNYDLIENRYNIVSAKIEKLKNSNIYTTNNYPKTKLLLEKLDDKIIEKYSYIESFKRKNGEIKNSLNFIIASLKNFDGIDKNHIIVIQNIISKILKINSNIGISNYTKVDIDTSSLNGIIVKEDNNYMKLFKTHVELLKRDLPSYVDVINKILIENNFDSIFENFEDTLTTENIQNANKINSEYYLLIGFALLTLLIIIYYILLIEKEKKQIIQLQDDYKKSISIDILTGLKNRNAFIENKRAMLNPTIILFDISRFGELNNLYGVRVGDFILQSVAKRFDKEISKLQNTELYRVGADQFVILFEELELRWIESIANEILKVMEEPYFYEKFEQPISLQFQAGISNIKPYILNATIALKSIENSYDKKVSIYNDNLNETKTIKENIDMIQKIKYALDNNNIVMMFQPLIDLTTNKIFKYEALVRLKDGDKYISPYFFLELSKKAKLYTQITRAVIEQSIKAIKIHNIDVSINLSIEDILHLPTQDFILDIVNLNYEIAKKITFEILESEEIKDFKALQAFIKEVKKFGCKIAIDDFGSGYSNYHYLLELNADILKIDGSLIKNIDKSENNRLVVKSIVEFAKLTHIQTVAEFISSKEIEKTVKELGLNYGQGFYYSEPKLLD